MGYKIHDLGAMQSVLEHFECRGALAGAGEGSGVAARVASAGRRGSGAAAGDVRELKVCGDAGAVDAGKLSTCGVWGSGFGA